MGMVSRETASPLQYRMRSCLASWSAWLGMLGKSWFRSEMASSAVSGFGSGSDARMMPFWVAAMAIHPSAVWKISVEVFGDVMV